MAEQSIKTLFASAEQLSSQLESAYDRNSSIFQENLAAAISNYEACRQLADRLGLFSPNESLEDIASGDLQYLLINVRLGDLFNKVSHTNRKEALQEARTAYERYLSILSDYGILAAAEKRLYEQYSDDPTTFSTISTKDFGLRRAAKIANFKLEKELKQKLDFLSKNPAYLEHDDDAVRALQLTQIALSTHNTFQALETLNMELDILKLAPTATDPGPESLERDYRERNGIRGGDEYSDRLDRPSQISAGHAGPMLSRDGKPMRPFTLLDNRQRLQNGVFKSGHNLPTMTIDEYLDEERRRGGIIEGGGAASGLSPEPDEDNYAKGEEETMKAREWDEYVEANPKGSGNTLNRG